MPTRRALLLASLIAALAAAPAHASSFGAVLQNYQAHGGRIDPCAFTSAQLSDAAGSIPNDFAQYTPDLGAAIQAALQARARGDCDAAGGGGSSSSGGVPVPVSPGAPPSSGGGAPVRIPFKAPGGQQIAAPPGEPVSSSSGAPLAGLRPVSAATDSGPPAPLIVLAVLGGLVLLAFIALGVGRALGWEPRWARGIRHAFGEAGWRAGGVWSEFTDWLRLGR